MSEAGVDTPDETIGSPDAAGASAPAGRKIAYVLDASALLCLINDEPVAFATGVLRASTRSPGLSFGDRACLALAASCGATALTTGKAWADAGEKAGMAVETLR